MNQNPDSLRRGARVLQVGASLIIVVAGLKVAASLILPILIAAVGALICIRPMRLLMRLGIPSPIAMMLVVLAGVTALVFLSGVVGNSLAEFSGSLEEYQKSLEEIAAEALAKLDRFGADVSFEDSAGLLDGAALMRLVASTTQEVLNALSDIVMILLIMIFMLAEANGMPNKLRRAFGDPEADLSEFSRVTNQVYGYLSIKAAISLLTGVLVGILCMVIGVDFPVLWGLVAFLFNFVPNIGSIIAAIPPVLLTLIQLNATSAATLAGGYIAINMLIGNFLEPRVMGRRLGLSPLVVLLSLIFWSWVWGPVGMLLSLPLTMVVKILLEHSDDFRFIAVLLGPSDESAPA